MFGFFRKKRKGSLTVEATLVFPLVIITLLFIANILNICMVHLCMQQALNNTAKKISQDSYMIYRFSGEDNYSKFINNLSDINKGYETFNQQAENTKGDLKEAQDCSIDVIESFGTLSVSFEGEGSLFLKIERFIDNFCNLIDRLVDAKKSYTKLSNSINELIDAGKENLEAIVMKLLVDSGSSFITSNIVEHIFNNYTNQLGVPASKIQNMKFLSSSLNEDGSYTVVLEYEYKNPFSFVNSESVEMKSTLINKIISMKNIITIKPFIGKNGTSFRTIETN